MVPFCPRLIPSSILSLLCTLDEALVIFFAPLVSLRLTGIKKMHCSILLQYREYAMNYGSGKRRLCHEQGPFWNVRIMYESSRNHVAKFLLLL
uniref:Uncharacterized protein n=1 Tax=Arundo donax TaxID=35708 RepID=A0A0A9EMH8_ARUDO